MAKNDTLPVNASRDDVEAYLKSQHSGSDFEVRKEHVDEVLAALQNQRGWRASLNPNEQFALVGVPGIHGPLDPDNPPPGVTVINRGKTSDGS